MIYQMNQNEHTQNQFSDAVKELQIGKLLRKSNISKSVASPHMRYSNSCYCWVFQGKNLFRFLNSKRKDQGGFKKYLLSFPE